MPRKLALLTSSPLGLFGSRWERLSGPFLGKVWVIVRSNGAISIKPYLSASLSQPQFVESVLLSGAEPVRVARTEAGAKANVERATRREARVTDHDLVAGLSYPTKVVSFKDATETMSLVAREDNDDRGGPASSTGWSARPCATCSLPTVSRPRWAR